MKSTQRFSVLIWTDKRKADLQGNVPLYARITYIGKRAEISIGRKIDPKNWDSETGYVKGPGQEVKDLNSHLIQVSNDMEIGEEVDPAHLYRLQNELDQSGIYLRNEVENFSDIYFKPKQKQSYADHKAINTLLDPPVSRFSVLLRDHEEEAELWRGKLQAFRNLYLFLSQVIPYQDSELEKLFVFLRHLSPKLPKRNGAPAYNFDDEVRLDYYRLQKISEGSISLSDGNKNLLDGPTEVGTAALREDDVPLSTLVGLINERFGTDFNQADQYFFDQMVETALLDKSLIRAAAVNPEDKFELVFKNLLQNLFIERIDQNEEIFARFMNDHVFQQMVTNWLSSQAYQKLKAS